jgi:hypothetical protein
MLNATNAKIHRYVRTGKGADSGQRPDSEALPVRVTVEGGTRQYLFRTHCPMLKGPAIQLELAWPRTCFIRADDAGVVSHILKTPGTSLRVANLSPTPTAKTNDFLAPFGDIGGSEAAVSGRF